MNLYLMSQRIVQGWDTYDSAVVAAESEEDARTIHPSEFVTHVRDGKWMGTYTGGGEYDQGGDGSWVSFDDINEIKVEFLGETERARGVVLSSFNAG